MNQNQHYRRILIVEDEPYVQRTLERVIRRIDNGYSIIADNGEAARKILEAESCDLMLCDINLPGESGLELIQYVHDIYPDMAVIVITGIEDPEMANKTLALGSYGYVVKPFKTTELIINITNALRRQKLEIENRKSWNQMQEIVDKRTKQLATALNGAINALARTLESRDSYTAGHQFRVAALAGAVATEMGMPDDAIMGIRMSSMIHDLGKIGIPAELLSKPSRLSDIEFALIKTHPEVGYSILKDFEFPWPVADIVHQHHEKMNGSGYPLGINSDSILLEARIVCVADVIEAMASHRPYRPALGLDIAMEEINNKSGVLFDPDVVDACNTLHKANDLFTMLNQA